MSEEEGLKYLLVFLKNSTSSNKFKIIPKQYIVKTTNKNFLKKLLIR